MRLRFPASVLLVFLCAGSTFAQQNPAPAGSGSDFAQLYSQGMAAFNAGDFAKAAADLDALVNKAEFSPQLEPVFYTVGSAYFNLGDHKKAVAAFKRYQEKFPNGPHIGEASFGIAQANLLAKNFAEAASQFAELEKDPRFREQALFFSASAAKENKKPDQAIALLEKLTAGELKTATGVHGAMLLAQLYAQKGTPDKTVALINRLHERIRLVENIVELNAMTVELGDQLYGKKLYAEALECYRAAYPREQIIRLQEERIAAMQRRVEENLAIARQDSSQFGSIAAANNQIKNDIVRTQQLLEEFKKLPSITVAIYTRLARCFQEIDRKWEAVVVYNELLDRTPAGPEREPALFSLITALADVNQFKKALHRAEDYLREFKDGPNAETVGYLLGALALQANDPRAAEAHFSRMLAEQPNSSFRDQMRYLVGNAKFMEGRYGDAADEYRNYLKEFPKGQNVEDANYRLTLTSLFAGKYEDAMNGLRGYVKKYPQGQYLSDAKYRLAVCKYAASLYDEVIDDCKAWEREFSNNQQLGEVLALLADAYGASNRDEEAISIYVRSYKTAATDEVMNYSLLAASKLLQKRAEWGKVSELFSGFIEEKPDHPTVISALYWIGKAKAREGKVDEAKKITADTIRKYIGDPQRETVEQLLTQLAQLCAKKKKLDTDTEGTAPAASSDAADPGAELDALLGETEKEPTARARVLFAKAELARLRRQNAEEEKSIQQLADGFKPEDLSPLLLGRAGDHSLSKQKFDQAAIFYRRLLDEFPKSENLDFAYNGLGEIALQKNDLPTALRFFSDGTDKIAASQKLKELTLGKAKTLLAMNKLDEAKKIFEQVASVREWRGESTAFSVFSLGEIEAKLGRWPEANAYFQRVYVGYQKFLPWVAKAYIRSAESFEKMGKPEEAANTYRELLRKAEERKELANFAETEQARKRLEALGTG